MTPKIVSIQSIQPVTHNVLQIITDKPDGLTFQPGQAADISILKDGWKNKKRSFTFTSLPTYSYLEFVIKTYPEHKGVTNELLMLHSTDTLLVHDVFGSIQYRGEGLFVAGGAGITPFISIVRDLNAKNEIGNNKLIFANKTEADIILKNEFSNLLGKNFINILSDGKSGEFLSGLITKELLADNIEGTNSFIYLCGPPPMMNAIENQLAQLNVTSDRIITETF